MGQYYRICEFRDIKDDDDGYPTPQMAAAMLMAEVGQQAERCRNPAATIDRIAEFAKNLMAEFY